MGEVASEAEAEAVLGFKHLVLVKFKEDAKVEEILKGLEKLVFEIDLVKSFEWGQDKESQEMLRQGLTHAFLMTFEKKEDYTNFVSHPSHVEFSSTFSAAIDKIVLLDFDFALVKPPPQPPSPPRPLPPPPEPVSATTGSIDDDDGDDDQDKKN